MKRILALLLCLVLCFSLLPAALAEDIEIIDEAEKAIVSIEPEEDIVVEPEAAPFAEAVPNADSSVAYRALLVGEVNFSWETATRNRGDVERLDAMLKSVSGPQGNSYSVTSKYDLSRSAIQSAIKSAFSGADSNDVSFFFIATHGVVDIATGSEAGELVTIEKAGVTDGYLTLKDLATWLKAVPGKIIVVLGSCGSGAAIVSNGNCAFQLDASGESDAFFTEAVIRTFEEADKSVYRDEPNTGEFRDSKFYVLTAAAHQESSWGTESYSLNFFPYYFVQGSCFVDDGLLTYSDGTHIPAGTMLADDDGNKIITLNEIYEFCYDMAYGPYNGSEYQHAQVYPTNSSYALFSGLRMNKNKLTLAVKKTSTLKATLTTGDVPSNLTWSSSNTKVATVNSSGVVTAKKYGTATITAKVNNDLAVTCKVQTLFYDVTDSSKYYYKPVYWAADKGITAGYDGEYFDPQGTCTREQMMTFLWRMKGKPEPSSTSNPFSDIKSGDYYYKAVLWGVEKGITNGYADGTFGVGKSCTREDAMTFLWRLAGKPNPSSTTNPFSDLKSSAYYYKPVLWASENGIAKGYDDGTYGVGKACLREHMVTFLYRYYNL